MYLLLFFKSLRKLAEISHSSAEQIRNEIHAFQTLTSTAITEMSTSAAKMTEGSNAVAAIGNDLESVLVAVRNVNNEIQDVSAVTEEVSSASEDVLASMEEVISLATDNASRTYSVAEASDIQKDGMDSLVNMIQLLNRSSANLRTALEKFK